MANRTAGETPEFHIGDRLEKALQVAGVSHADMARYLGVSRNTISNYVHMRTPVNDGTLRLWSMRTGIPLEWLTTGKRLIPHQSSGAAVRETQMALSV